MAPESTPQSSSLAGWSGALCIELKLLDLLEAGYDRKKDLGLPSVPFSRCVDKASGGGGTN